MTLDKSFDKASKLAAEAKRFRAVLAKGRSAKQLELFDFLVEHSADERSPKEIEVAVALLGNEAALESNADSGIRVYVHRLRKRLDDYYDNRSGPRLSIPIGEYRVVLESDESPYRSSGFARAFLANPALGSGMALFAFAAILYAVWMALPTSPTPGLATVNERQGLLGTSADLLDPVIVVGDHMVLAETEDQRSIQRIVLNPEIETRDQFGEFLKENPETFYRLYDFGLRFASNSSLQAAWAVQTRLTTPTGTKRTEVPLVPVSAVKPELLGTHDVIFIGRLSQLGILEQPVFTRSKMRMVAHDRLEDIEKKTSFTGGIYTEAQTDQRPDYGYLSVRDGPNGRRLIVFAGLGDRGVTAMANLLDQPREIASLKRRVGDARQFEAVFEVRSPFGQPLERRLVALYTLP